jgi:type IV secretory pathway VirB2 component (pilin)
MTISRRSIFGLFAAAPVAALAAKAAASQPIPDAVQPIMVASWNGGHSHSLAVVACGCHSHTITHPQSPPHTHSFSIARCIHCGANS